MRPIYFMLMVMFVFLTAVEVRAAQTNSLDANIMKVALRTALPEEDGFIDYVLALVDKGTLPVDLVEGTFLWAKKKPQNKFQYFKRGLILRAEQKGITI
jgi:hypothetical protein